MIEKLKELSNSEYQQFLSSNPSEKEKLEWFHDHLKDYFYWIYNLCGQARDVTYDGYVKAPLNELRETINKGETLLMHFSKLIVMDDLEIRKKQVELMKSEIEKY